MERSICVETLTNFELFNAWEQSNFYLMKTLSCVPLHTMGQAFFIFLGGQAFLISKKHFPLRLKESLD